MPAIPTPRRPRQEDHCELWVRRGYQAGPFLKQLGRRKNVEIVLFHVGKLVDEKAVKLG